MEQEERDAYKVRYGEEALRLRDIHAKFAVFASERLVSPQAEEWVKFLEMLMELEKLPEELFGFLAKFLPKPASNLYPLTVDYSRSVADGIRAGHYDWVNQDITARHFPTEKSGCTRVLVELLHLDRNASAEEVLAEMEARGLRPADLHELLAEGEKYPEIQREFPVVALGSAWRGSGGDRRVPYIRRDGSRRLLGLGWTESAWDGHCRFAVVRK